MKQAITAAILITLIFSSVFAQEEKIVRVRATVESESVQTMEGFDVNLQVRVRSSWHINSEDPGNELLIPTTVRMENPDQVELLEVVYPEAKKRRFPYYKKPLPVFESRFTITLKLKLKPSVESGPCKLQGVLRFQACNQSSCLPPEEVPFNLDLIVKESPIANEP